MNFLHWLQLCLWLLLINSPLAVQTLSDGFNTQLVSRSTRVPIHHIYSSLSHRPLVRTFLALLVVACVYVNALRFAHLFDVVAVVVDSSVRALAHTHSAHKPIRRTLHGDASFTLEYLRLLFFFYFRSIFFPSFSGEHMAG